MSLLSALEAGVGGVSCCGSIPLRVVLGLVALIVVVVPLSTVVIPAIVVLTMVVPLSVGWRSVPVNIHGDWSVVHPAQGI